MEKKKPATEVKVVTGFHSRVGGGGSRTPVLTCRPTASTSLAAVRVFETLRASGRRSGFWADWIVPSGHRHSFG